MERPATTVESLDSIKVYLWMMGGLTFVTVMWLIYNYFELGDYRKKINYGWQDYNNMLTLEEDIPVGEEKSCKIENVFSFFREKLPPQISIKPAKVIPETQVVSTDEITYKEYTYEINYEKVDRNTLGIYMHYIQKQNDCLKVKHFEIKRVANAQPFEDKWDATIIFAYREETEEEEE